MKENENDFGLTKDESKKGKRIFWKIIGLVILLFIVGYGVRLVLLPAKTAVEVLEKTMDADNVIFEYEYFYKEYNDWLQIQDKIKTHEASLEDFYEIYGKDPKEWGISGKQERQQIVAIINGLNDQRNDIESLYNAKSEMINKTLFKSNSLPWKLENGVEVIE